MRNHTSEQGEPVTIAITSNPVDLILSAICVAVAILMALSILLDRDDR